jgi:hypothetical protein
LQTPREMARADPSAYPSDRAKFQVVGKHNDEMVRRFDLKGEFFWDRE